MQPILAVGREGSGGGPGLGFCAFFWGGSVGYAEDVQNLNRFFRISVEDIQNIKERRKET